MYVNTTREESSDTSHRSVTRRGERISKIRSSAENNWKSEAKSSFHKEFTALQLPYYYMLEIEAVSLFRTLSRSRDEGDCRMKMPIT